MSRTRSDYLRDSFPIGFGLLVSDAVKQVQSGCEFGVAHPPGQASKSGFLIV
jgi:hypothetical protein